MKNFIYLTAFILCFHSCQIIDKCAGYACFSPPPDFVFGVLDKNGNDLLNQTRAQHFDTSQIKIFILENGQKTALKYEFNAQKQGTIFCSDMSWRAIDVEQTYSIQLDSNNIESVKLQLREVNEDCCTFFRFEKVVINNVNVATTRPFFIVK